MASAQAIAGPAARAETDDQVKLGNIMARGSIADVMHDFSDLSISKSAFKKGKELRQNIFDGLPDFNEKNSLLNANEGDAILTNFLLSEPDFMRSIIESVNDTDLDPAVDFNFVANTAFSQLPENNIQGFVFDQNKDVDGYYNKLQELVDKKFTSINRNGDGNGKSFKLTTKTGHEYTVRQAVIKNKKVNNLLKKNTYGYFDPQPILNALEISDNSAFIVDFAAISLPDFLTQSPSADLTGENNKKLYFITNPATENDAAGKTSATTPVYRNILGNEEYEAQFNNGVEIYSLVQAETDNKVTNYNWLLDGGDSATNEFFTAYNFALSDLIEVKDGKIIKFKTDLTISDPRYPLLKPQFIPDSGNFGKISSVVANILKKIKNIFKKAEKEDNFFLNSKLQHKRSGDWLQLLSCMTAKNMKYKYPKCKLDGYSDKSFDQQFSDVYFVTHDVVPFAIALSLGIDTIFTHSDTAAYYVFKTGAGETKEQKDAKLLEKAISIKGNPIVQIDNSIITDYNLSRSTILNTYIRDINQILNNISTTTQIKIDDDKVFKGNFTNLFLKLNEYALFISRYSVINSNIEDERLYTELNEYPSITIENATIFLQKISSYNNKKKNIDAILKNMPSQIDTKKESKEVNAFVKLIKDFKLSNSLIKLARGDIKEEMTPAQKEVVYRNKLLIDIIVWDDIFDSLSTDIKNEINKAFVQLYKNLFDIPFESLTEADLKSKFDIKGRNKLEDYMKFKTIMEKLRDEILIKFSIKTSLVSSAIEMEIEQPLASVAAPPVTLQAQAVASPAVASQAESLQAASLQASPLASPLALQASPAERRRRLSIIEEDEAAVGPPPAIILSPITTNDVENIVDNIKLFDNEIINDYIGELTEFKGGVKSSTQKRKMKQDPLATPLHKEGRIGKLSYNTGTDNLVFPRNELETPIGQIVPEGQRRSLFFRFPTPPPTPIISSQSSFSRPFFSSRVRLTIHDFKLFKTEKINKNLTNKTYSLLNRILTKDYKVSDIASLQNHTDCFHPLLPIFMLVEALHQSFKTVMFDYNNEINIYPHEEVDNRKEILRKYIDNFQFHIDCYNFLYQLCTSYKNYFSETSETLSSEGSMEEGEEEGEEGEEEAAGYIKISNESISSGSVENIAQKRKRGNSSSSSSSSIQPAKKKIIFNNDHIKYKIGLGLRSLFFTSPEKFMEVMGEKYIDFKDIMLFIYQLKNYISGYIDYNYEAAAEESDEFEKYISKFIIGYEENDKIDYTNISKNIDNLLHLLRDTINYDRNPSSTAGGKRNKKYTKKYNTTVFKKTRRHKNNKRVTSNKSKKKSHRFHKKKYTIRY